ncbi:MAG: bifunctional diaminohydroxyphosphoribosylaminopyrimidine deaminase/5-amino-6-(5-phosphoribosylamino)uracil reductase RibD [Flavobacteriales bacterium]|jgi:diaminohydroxyphosphoribosylaminopyrimidine deaminase/5-amino-6-(5-phosphoribosylamino)uracil reductase|nr:bifunctional diaminohydroxyphosphoribosylaminopyrimidine deaminase/5-amino-6-(5-phosphoribosylamino)uracil reductase RibD [Flavobacteriales bacterium]
MKSQDEIYMQRCIDLAQKGLKSVAPNPMVGCVIVNQGKVIAEGYHLRYGEAHAEVNAIKQVKNPELFKTATLYVSLEPCAHFGKTPPCSNLIVEKGIRKVVIGCVDPFAEVAGKGIEKLKKSGVDVTVGVLEQEALELNKRFFTFHEKKRPYVVLKWAQTLDGYVDIKRKGEVPQINWITRPQTKQLTDTWRCQEMAILVGKNTILNDNPKLTVRTILGRNPLRLVIDRNVELPLEYNVFNSDAKTVVFNEVVDKEEGHIKYVKIDFSKALDAILDWLYQQDIQSVLVEGGAYTLQQFIKENKWDEARIYTGNTFFNEGVKAPQLTIEEFENTSYGKDQITIVNNHS